MIEYREMSSNDAIILQSMMMTEEPTYLTYFTAFSAHDALLSQCVNAIKDGFFVLTIDNNIAGFFCLRGLDSGYVKPSFGVYISSEHQGKGLARSALKEAAAWCKRYSLPAIILKVAKCNERAYQLYAQDGFLPVEQFAKRKDILMEKRIL